jgi:hypothetical protein
MSREKIYLFPKDENGRLCCARPAPDADHAVVVGACCPYCGVSPFKIAGSGRRPSKDDRAWEADAGCLACKAHVGTLRLEVNTLFGVREDEAVARLGIRIY